MKNRTNGPSTKQGLLLALIQNELLKMICCENTIVPVGLKYVPTISSIVLINDNMSDLAVDFLTNFSHCELLLYIFSTTRFIYLRRSRRLHLNVTRYFT